MIKLTKNIRISFYILIPIVLWMASGLFKNDKVIEVEEKSELFSVQTVLSSAIEYQPLIKLKATTKSEARVDVKAKTSGEVVKIGATQGKFIKKDEVLCSLGVVELNRTEVKAPFGGFVEQIVKFASVTRKPNIFSFKDMKKQCFFVTVITFSILFH